MVRLPRGWGAAFHPQASRRGMPQAYRPGWQGTGAQRIEPLPATAYRGRITGVPLTGGQAQGTIPAGTASGSATSPGSFNILATLVITQPGPVTVSWSVTLAGTVGAADANNFAIRVQSGPMLRQSVNAGADGTYPQASFTVTGPVTLQLETWSSAPTAGSTYSGTMSVTGQALTLSVGPQGLGTTWYPAQVTLSTTTGPLDTSTAQVFLGAQGVPVTLVGQQYTGNGTVALAVPSMTPGQVLIIQWTSAQPGDVAAANVIGTMDALTTGLEAAIIAIWECCTCG